MSGVRIAGCLINLVASDYPHFRSVVVEGLWGFGERYRGRWSLLRPGTRALLYFRHRGVRGVWGVAEIVEVFEDRRPVEFWVRDPSGYPLRVKLRLLQPVVHAPSPGAPLRLEVFDGVKPLRKEELAALGVRMLKPAPDRWSLILFGEGKPATYSSEVFERVLNEFMSRNAVGKAGLSHDDVVRIVMRIGELREMIVEREVETDVGRIDVAWKKTHDSVPCMVFEVSIESDPRQDLFKLKYAIDKWNSKAVLVTTNEKKYKALKMINEAFREVKESFRVVTVDEVVELQAKLESYKELERRLGLL